jgi:hypothetical protein
MIIADEKAVYHVMSRTSLDGFPLKDVEKDFMLGLIKSLSEFMREIKVGFARYYNRRHKSS